MRSGQGFTSSNKDNSANFSGEKKYNDAFRAVCFYTARKKNLSWVKSCLHSRSLKVFNINNKSLFVT